MRYTVKQLADLAGVSRRTLHYYDEIGLLKPEGFEANGYRYYGGQSVFRLQQILFFRELGFSLKEIQLAIEDEDFNLIQALGSHKKALQERRKRLDQLLHTIEVTINTLKGEVPMDEEQLFVGFDDEQEKEYAQGAVSQWGDEAVQSIQRWNAYSREKQASIREEGNAIYLDSTKLIGQDPKSAPVQNVVKRWHQHMRYYYEPDIERLLGLADMYVESPDFRKTFDRFDSRLAPFLREAIQDYCAILGKP